MNKEKYKYIGNLSQLLRVENFRMEGGRSDNVRATAVTNENGLSYTVIADRCMDIAYLSYKGVNISFINPNGIVGPQYYDRVGTNWLKNFTAGFLTTCGLDNVGNPCMDQEELGLHGSISNTPAQDYSAVIVEDKGENQVCIRGTMNDSTLFGRRLKLNRTITSFQDKDTIILEDEIVNTGFEREEYMQLYHCNIGYPFLSQECSLYIKSDSVTGANPFSEANKDKWNTMEPPSKIGEMCFIHDIKDENGLCRAGMFNDKLHIGFILSYKKGSLDNFLQWRYLHEGAYVVGLEPATNLIGGKAEERKAGRIKTVNPGSSVKHRLQFDFYNCKEDFESNLFN